MEIYSTEEQQVEAIKKFWQDYGTSVLAGAVIGLGALYSWNWYSEHQVKQTEAASQAFGDVIAATQDDKALAAAVAQYDQAHSQQGYSALLQLVVAKSAVEAGDLAKAEAALKTVLTAKPGEAIETIAAMRLARVQAEQGQIDTALTTLDGVNSEAFAAEKAELKGDFLVRKGDLANAKTAYQDAVAKGGVVNSPALQVKLDNLTQA
ncbi:tetratricopeptide repeat protein [Shewanella avicenniae]|uniref:Ancillary SecYEG translocon subunit n=1 Tax=Shewanella avicenniae TaxID=2814294 RepID=A0ABX7QV32_9GAMM|nr:tetratricopeptide repeat protein [Shewanella avicenniae]QSX34840.1 tetratricopeptide repeat protein [Shewanella avicenniae]